MSDGGRRRHLYPRTLSRQLMVGVSALVTLLAVAVGTLSISSMYSSALSMVDNDLSHSMAAFAWSFRNVPDQRVDHFLGQAHGTVLAVLDDGRIVDSTRFLDSGPQPLTAPARQALESRQWETGAPDTLQIPGLGTYRATETMLDDTTRLVSAMPMQDVRDAVAKKALAVAVLIAVAAALAAMGTVALVRATLRPLRRVAATAARAAQMSLVSDNDGITTRVRRADTDPDNEVGIVGDTLNRLLANVDFTLTARAEADRAMRRFISDASHELRTPLAAIQGYAELTRQDSMDLPPTTEYALTRIESESRRMNSLVDDMLLLSRLAEGQGIEVERVDLAEVVADAVNDVAAATSTHRFVTRLPLGPVWIDGDRSRLHQVASNLLANARTHTPDGVTVTATVRAAGADDDAVKLMVADNGPGIAPDIVPVLFERFAHGHRTRPDEGPNSGLGLAIVESIVEAHGGSVTARSRPGDTVFTVTLPAP